MNKFFVTLIWTYYFTYNQKFALIFNFTFTLSLLFFEMWQKLTTFLKKIFNRKIQLIQKGKNILENHSKYFTII